VRREQLFSQINLSLPGQTKNKPKNKMSNPGLTSLVEGASKRPRMAIVGEAKAQLSKSKKVSMTDFTEDRLTTARFVNPDDTTGVRYRNSYAYPGDQAKGEFESSAVPIIKYGQLPAPYGITIPYADPNKPDQKPKPGEFNMALGPLGVKKDDDGNFIFPPGTPEHIQVTYHKIQAADKKVFAKIKSENKGAELQFKYTIRSSPDKKTNEYNNFLIHAKINMNNSPIPVFSLLQPDGTIQQLSFRQAVNISAKCMSVGSVCMASTYRSKTGMVAPQLKINDVLIVIAGNEPGKHDLEVPDYSDYDLPVQPLAFKVLGPGEGEVVDQQQEPAPEFNLPEPPQAATSEDAIFLQAMENVAAKAKQEDEEVYGDVLK
jgi:hypothetical protein